MPRMTRRDFFGAIAFSGLSRPADAGTLTETLPASIGASFTFNNVLHKAHDLSLYPFSDIPQSLPPALEELDSDSWQEIRHKLDSAIPLGAYFRLGMFHVGYKYKRATAVNLIREGIASPVLYSPNLFDFGRMKIDKPLPSDAGFAGLSVHYPLNDPHVHSEVMSFLGASSFQFLGRKQKYGLSESDSKC